MVESPPQSRALIYNPNSSNTSSPYLGYSFRQSGFEVSSPCPTDISSSLQSFTLNDENTPPPSSLPDVAKVQVDSPVSNANDPDELTLLKAELDATLRKLALYEGGKADGPPPVRPQIVKYNPTSRNLFAGKSAIYPRDPFAFPDPMGAQIPVPPHPLPAGGASTQKLSPLQLPGSLNGSFLTRDGLGTGSTAFGHSVLTKAPPPRESLRSVSGPMPPVGENWRAPPAQRSVSLGMKNPPTQEAWNAGSGWTSSWNSSNRTQPRQQPDLGPGLVDPWVPLDVLPFPSQANLAYSLSRACTWTSRATIYRFRTT
jgi:hypothetical protein